MLKGKRILIAAGGTGGHINPALGTAGYIKEKAFLATVTETRDGRAYCLQKNKAINGACAELLTPGRCGMPVTLTDMRSADGQPIESSPHPGMIFSLDLPEARPGDIIRGV